MRKVFVLLVISVFLFGFSSFTIAGGMGEMKEMGEVKEKAEEVKDKVMGETEKASSSQEGANEQAQAEEKKGLPEKIEAQGKEALGEMKGKLGGD